MVTMQWGIVKCCRVVSAASCMEMTLGVVQVGLQWFLFSMIFVLYMIYYPPHLKYVESGPIADTFGLHSLQSSKAPEKREEWRLSVVLSWVTVIHIILISFTSFFLLLTATPSPSPTAPLPHQVSLWATFLGVSSAILAAIQYAPQIAHTYRHKVVGALSIPMMCIQSPGAVLMVLSIALRPGTNWTSWITFAVAGLMQGTLLVMCIIWKLRQNRLGLDDFGHPLPGTLEYEEPPARPLEHTEDVPGLVTSDDDDPAAVSRALAAALESAVESDVRSFVDEASEHPVNEETPLLAGASNDAEGKAKEAWRQWFSGWFGQ
ncbi:hypothetical protein HGRIS_012551 [Hohenbuehelia grisea]|uniref:Uncharacterized protein n=1 Tax=Hohenbuehelia grisea TaxID=104357 RepID=A0ABR3ISP5_9AGAR